VKTRIICLGNEIICDDGIGIRVGRVLAQLALGDGISVEFRPNLGLEMLEMVADAERLILVDAMKTGARPGHCEVLELSLVEALAQSVSCCHGVGLCELIQVAHKVMPGRVAERVTIVGIEGEILDRFGMQLSPSVAAALSPAVETVLGLLGAGEELVSKSREICRKMLETGFGRDQLMAG
jgi:hydrogenase maturation protease